MKLWNQQKTLHFKSQCHRLEECMCVDMLSFVLGICTQSFRGSESGLTHLEIWNSLAHSPWSCMYLVLLLCFYSCALSSHEDFIASVIILLVRSQPASDAPESHLIPHIPASAFLSELILIAAPRFILTGNTLLILSLQPCAEDFFIPAVKAEVLCGHTMAVGWGLAILAHTAGCWYNRSC